MGIDDADRLRAYAHDAAKKGFFQMARELDRIADELYRLRHIELEAAKLLATIRELEGKAGD